MSQQHIIDSDLGRSYSEFAQFTQGSANYAQNVFDVDALYDAMQKMEWPTSLYDAAANAHDRAVGSLPAGPIGLANTEVFPQDTLPFMSTPQRGFGVRVDADGPVERYEKTEGDEIFVEPWMTNPISAPEPFKFDSLPLESFVEDEFTTNIFGEGPSVSNSWTSPAPSTMDSFDLQYDFFSGSSTSSGASTSSGSVASMSLPEVPPIPGYQEPSPAPVMTQTPRKCSPTPSSASSSRSSMLNTPYLSPSSSVTTPFSSPTPSIFDDDDYRPARLPRRKARTQSLKTPYTKPAKRSKLETLSASSGGSSSSSKQSTRSRGCHPCPREGCTQVCKSAGDLRRHLQSLTHTEPAYSCGGCERRFTRPDALKRHHLQSRLCSRASAAATAAATAAASSA